MLSITKGMDKINREDLVQLLVRMEKLCFCVMAIYVIVNPCRLIKIKGFFGTDDQKEDTIKEEKQPKFQVNKSSMEDENGIAEGLIAEEDVISEQANQTNPFPNEQAVENITSVKNIPKVDNVVKYKNSDNDEWGVAEVISRRGKATCQYSSWMNVEDTSTKEKTCINLGVCEWSLDDNKPFVENVLNTPHNESGEILEAKKRSLKNGNTLMFLK